MKDPVPLSLTLSKFQFKYKANNLDIHNGFDKSRLNNVDLDKLRNLYLQSNND